MPAAGVAPAFSICARTIHNGARAAPSAPGVVAAMDSRLLLLLAATVVLIALLAFSAFFRRLLALTIRLAIFLGVSFVAIGATAVLMNGETIFGPPGTAARVARFLTAKYAATSRTGLGDAPCAVAQGRNTAGESRWDRGAVAQNAAASGAEHSPPAGEVNLYPELVTRGYPGIGQGRLFRMAENTVNGLGGWKIIRSDPVAGTLDCLYTTRVFRFEDDVKIVVTPANEVAVCSQSKVGEPGSNSLLRFFPGDFGANMGHIKQFYQALEPKIEAFYRAQRG